MKEKMFRILLIILLVVGVFTTGTLLNLLFAALFAGDFIALQTSPIWVVYCVLGFLAILYIMLEE
jgi:hypothetical protein